MDEKVSSNEVKYAQKITVALVKSPTYNDTTINVDQELNDYFKIQRRLKLNDLFSIRNVQNPKLYYVFKVVDVEPENCNQDFYIDNTHCSLTQKASAVVDKWIWQPSSSIVDVLSPYTNKMEKIIQFYHHFHGSNRDKLPLMLLVGPSGSGKSRCVEKVCSNLSFHLCKINCVNLAGESASAVEKRIEIFLHNSSKYGPCIVLFKSFQYLFKLKDINDSNKRIISSFFSQIANVVDKHRKEHSASHDLNKIFIVCTSNSKKSLDSTILSYFNHEIEIKNLNDEQRREFFEREFGAATSRNYDNSTVNELVKLTNNSIYFGEMKTLCDFIRQTTRESDFITKEHIETAVANFQSRRKFEQENRLNIEKINWNDVGGLGDIKEIITDTIVLPLSHPELFTSKGGQVGITRSGILLYGPPGTGKTLLAKAISNECNLNFLSVKGPELLDMYVGQTESNVRNLFDKARLNAPCVLFFDELDSLAPVRGRAGDSGGVMDRVVSQLLTEIDGLDKHETADDEKPCQIFLIGATNRPDLIDSSLLRPGRFDKLVYVPIAKSHSERLKIFQALTRKLPVDKNFDQDAFIGKCPVNLSGADFYSITNKARHHSLKRLIELKEQQRLDGNEHQYQDQDEHICINQSDFEQAIDDFQPTLNDAELLNYEKYFKNLNSNK